MDLTPVNSVELSEAIRAHSLTIDAGTPTAMFVWGSPGIGKSDAFKQAAARLDRELIDVRASQWDAVDTRGIPTVVDGRTSWAIPDLFPTDPDSRAVIFLDELNSAAPAVQAALYQLVLDRRLGEYVVPEGVMIAAAGNLETDRGVVHKMPTPLKDRFFHYLLEPDANAWQSWAMGAGIHTSVIAFVRFRPDLLHHWDANSASPAQATPRSWEFVSRAVTVCEREGINGSIERAMVTGKVGTMVGAEYLGFLSLMRTMVDPDEVIAHPDTAPISDEPSTNYAMCGALASRANRENFGAVMTYARRLAAEHGGEFLVLVAKTAAERNPEIQQTAAYIEYAADAGNDA